MIMLKDSVMEDVLKFLDHCEGQLIQLASSVTDLPLSPNSSWPHESSLLWSSPAWSRSLFMLERTPVTYEA